MSLSQAETDNLDHYTNAYAVFYKDVGAYQQLLEEHDVINWDQVFQIQGEIKCKTLGGLFFPLFLLYTSDRYNIYFTYMINIYLSTQIHVYTCYIVTIYVLQVYKNPCFTTNEAWPLG